MTALIRSSELLTASISSVLEKMPGSHRHSAGVGAALPSSAPGSAPGSGPTSSLIAVLLVANSARGSHIVFQWPPEPHHRATFYEPSASVRSYERQAVFDTSNRQDNGLGPSSPHMSIISHSPSQLARDARAYDTYLGYENNFLAGLLTPRRDLCHQKFELTVDDLVFVGHPVCADNQEGWVLNLRRGADGGAGDEHEAEQMSRGRAPIRNRHSSTFDLPPAPPYPSEDQSPLEPASRSNSFAYQQQQQQPDLSRSRVRRDGSRLPPQVESRPPQVESEETLFALSSFHFVLILDKPDPAPPHLPPGMASIIPASQLNTFNIDPNLSAQLYYDNIAFKMTAALYNEQCTSGYVSQEAACLDRERENYKTRGRRFAEFMQKMRERRGSLAKAMADLFESLSKNEGALITINNRIETHLQLPPILRETRRMLFSADLETERDVDEAHIGIPPFDVEPDYDGGGLLDSTANAAPFSSGQPGQMGIGMQHARDPQAYMFEEWKRTTGPHLVPWKTLLMLKTHKHSSTTAGKKVGVAASGPGHKMGLERGHRKNESHGSLIAGFKSFEMSKHTSRSESGSRNSFGNAHLRTGNSVFGETGYAPHVGAADMSYDNSSQATGLESRPMSSAASADGDETEYEDSAVTQSVGMFDPDGEGSLAAYGDDAMLLEARGIEAWVPRFATELEPKLDGIPTLKELALNLNWDLYQDVYPMVRHLIYYREARVIDVPFITSIYSICPLVDIANLPHLSKEWATTFPTLPKLVRVLSQLSSSATPFEKQLDTAGVLSFPESPSLQMPTNAKQELYLDALFWLLRAEVIVQIQIRYRIVATHEVKQAAKAVWEIEIRPRVLEREARMRSREEAKAKRERDRALRRAEMESAGATAGLLEPISMKSTTSPSNANAHLAYSDPSGGRPVDGTDSAIADGVDEEDDDLMDDVDDDADEELWEWKDFECAPSVIAEPGCPSSGEERLCLKLMMEGLPSDLVAVFDQALPFFNGKHSLDEIASRRNLSLSKLRALLRKRVQYVIAFFHP
ncbi:hypothetical protein A4X09_0g1499 [Tilletia walkeri]|uniref:Nitrogen permease regulator 3 n=1 Tax=Tilletia walkeri TaxID=117179 RepID=A0A8X7T7G6_9BASI|nr:hypothetical protein A4X09_0g1499 [Tilletia walkeri]